MSGKPNTPAAKAGNTNIDRRKINGWFLKGGLAGLGAFLAWKIFGGPRYKEVPEPPNLTVEAASVTEIPENSAKLFTFGPHKALLIHLPDGQYSAVTAVCTHMGCLLRYLPAEQQIWCPCHKGIFDVDGNVVSGPPPRPLKRYGIRISNDEIFVTNSNQPKG